MHLINLVICASRLFKKIKIERLSAKQQKQVCRYVDGQKGYKVVCGGVSCVFEFVAYEFCGHDNSASDTSSEVLLEMVASGPDEEDIDGGYGGSGGGTGPSRATIVPGGNGERTVAVDMEQHHERRGGQSDHVQAGHQRLEANDTNSLTGITAQTSTGVGTRSESTSIASNYNTPPNELVGSATPTSSISRVQSMVGSELGGPVSGQVSPELGGPVSGWVNPAPPVVNGLRHGSVGHVLIPDQGANSFHDSRRSDVATNPFRASGLTMINGSSTSVASHDKNAVTAHQFEEPDNSRRFSQSTAV